jgi:succinate dehydrogenase/fumarate reductase-like Fe-S protein
MKNFRFKKIFALLNLAFYFILHFLKKPFVWGRRGLPAFLENYKKDGIVPLTLEDKQLLRRFSECINCGFCDTACPALQKLPRERFLGPSFIATTFTRSFPDFHATGLDLTLCAECNECEKVCPNAVPIKDGIVFVQEKIAEQMKWAS